MSKFADCMGWTWPAYYRQGDQAVAHPPKSLRRGQRWTLWAQNDHLHECFTFCKIYLVLTILHQLICRGVANFGTPCTVQYCFPSSCCWCCCCWQWCLKGPFRDPREVQYLRSRAACPSLRCESSYFAVDEARKQHQLDDWVKRVTDDEYDNIYMSLSFITLYLLILCFLHCVQKKTHSRFLLYVCGQCLDLHKIFRVCLWGIKYCVDIKIKYSLLPMT